MKKIILLLTLLSDMKKVTDYRSYRTLKIQELLLYSLVLPPHLKKQGLEVAGRCGLVA